MTYYLVNNYVHQQQSPQQQPPPPPPPSLTYGVKSPTTEGLRRPSVAAHYVALRPAANKQQQLPPPRYQLAKPQQDRFVPSVRYDPKDSANQDADYFVPVRYSSSKDYEEYGSGLRTTIPVPTIPTTPRTVSFLKPVPKPQDYAYPEFESVRFVKAQRVQPLRYAAARPTAEPGRGLNLGHIVKSLHLTSRLPEVLSKDNIDSSIRTLEEILRILNMGKKESYDPLYEKYKPEYVKPKVITESSFEATQLAATPPYEDEELVEPPVEMKPAPAYVNQVKAHLSLVRPQELKPVAAYGEQIKPHLTLPHQEQQLVEIKPYVGRDKPLAPVVQLEEPEIEEQVVEIKPKSPYVQQAQTPPPQQTVNKIVEYYVPIVQDIDEEPAPVAPAKEAPAPSTERPVDSSYRAVAEGAPGNGLLDDNKYNGVPASPNVHQLNPHLHAVQPLLKYGATRGKPHVDYPAYTEIPETEFSCKQQRYKGFFGDPETGCQVWHYCDLNGGKSSFLCPNGTIFSQVSLTCDWWFNVKCESTTQLYVLNERLYKYILPIMPKFPEDFTGPEVDKYLELKFKEMEAKMKEKKKKKDEQENKDKNAINTLQSIEDSK